MTYAKLRFDPPFSCVSEKEKSFSRLRTRRVTFIFAQKKNARRFLRIGRGPFVRKAIVNLLMVLHRRETSLVPLYKLGLAMPNSTGLPTARGIKSYRSSISFFLLLMLSDSRRGLILSSSLYCLSRYLKSIR